MTKAPHKDRLDALIADAAAAAYGWPVDVRDTYLAALADAPAVHDNGDPVALHRIGMAAVKAAWPLACTDEVPPKYR